MFTGPMHSGGTTMKRRDIFTKVGKNEIDHESEMEDERQVEEAR